MKWIIDKDTRLPVKSWCERVEPQAMRQALNLANHPVTAWHVALMPDCHVGYGMPIGGVIATMNALIPNAVGVDIGCGVMAVESTLPATSMGDMECRRDFMQRVKRRIPAGEGQRHGSAQNWSGFADFVAKHPEAAALWPSELDRQNLGTLGGGNHFIELQASEEDRLWLMIHSGSRNLGQRIATHYHAIALQLCSKKGSSLPDPDLAWLSADSNVGRAYLRDMNFALEYAHENRCRMMEICKAILAEMLSGTEFQRVVHIHHNYAALENHLGRDAFIHRKGATSARRNELGIIPGSMGTPSFIVRGLGNPDSFSSCSHGAGRVMGRNEANRTLDEDKCNIAMKGIAFDPWGKSRSKWGKKQRGATTRSDLSEAPQAYKKIEDVIAAQRDLVEPLVKLRPLAVVKG